MLVVFFLKSVKCSIFISYEYGKLILIVRAFLIIIIVPYKR